MDDSLLEISFAYRWLIAGVAFIALEAFGIPGVGFFFLGLGALATGILLSIDLISDEQLITQFALCFGVAVVAGVVLWRPIQKIFLRGRTSPGYNDVIGATAIVGAPGLRKGADGEVLWSGTIMKAALDPSVTGPVPENAAVKVVAVVGAKLIVIPKPE